MMLNKREFENESKVGEWCQTLNCELHSNNAIA